MLLVVADPGPGHVVGAVVVRADAKAVTLMREHAVRRLPVTEQGRIVGVVSLGDLAMERDERSALTDISAEPPNC